MCQGFTVSQTEFGVLAPHNPGRKAYFSLKKCMFNDEGLHHRVTFYFMQVIDNEVIRLIIFVFSACRSCYEDLYQTGVRLRVGVVVRILSFKPVDLYTYQLQANDIQSQNAEKS